MSIYKKVEEILATPFHYRIPPQTHLMDTLMSMEQILSRFEFPTSFHIILANYIKEKELRLLWARYYKKTKIPFGKGIFMTTEEKSMSEEEIYNKLDEIYFEIEDFCQMELGYIVLYLHRNKLIDINLYL
jgi:hypothetical protein